ncbi:PKS-NRPS1 [Symbiodinium necroappetens]|uniref:PKS-NRPS1 protein n=1 Tax=Symbiodinium necroappetens TaxID=1628268 RepID=A0A812XVI3_9DINO|nr:PKS-NRPS1 [Symbiodinium necroappetens]
MTAWLRMGDGCLGCLPWPWPSKPHFDALEEKVEEVWRRVLALPPGGIRPEDSFLELGGESLLALRVCATLRYELGGEAEPDEDVAPGDEKAPQFGHVSGAFAVATLLAAPSFRAFCDGLRRGGYHVPGDGVPCQGPEQKHQAGTGMAIFLQHSCSSFNCGTCRVPACLEQLPGPFVGLAGAGNCL